MFELSFGEILLFTTVALVVLGPERLPVLARFLGRTFAKIQNMVNNVKAELGADMALHDLHQMKDELRASAQSLREDLQSQARQLQQVKQDYASSWQPEEMDDDMQAERSWVALQQSHVHQSSLAQQSRSKRKHIRPYQHVKPNAKRIGSRRQNKLNSHG